MVYEMHTANATIKSKSQPNTIFNGGKIRNVIYGSARLQYMDENYREIRGDMAYWDAEFKSTWTVVDVQDEDGKITKVARECQRVVFDIDFKYTADKYKKLVTDKFYNPSTKRFELSSKWVICQTLVRNGVKADYPDIVVHFTNIDRSRNDGLSISIYFPSFLLENEIISHMARDAQEQVGCLLQHIGIGVDTAAYGLKRITPNENNQKFSGYKNKRKGYSKKEITRKYPDGSLSQKVISKLLDDLKKYKPIWDKSRKANPDKYLYADVAIETMLANLYRQGFKSQEFKSQKAAAEFLDICIPTFCTWLKGKAPSCLTVERSLVGYMITLSMTSDQEKRARAVLTHSDLDRWIFPHPTDVQDGIRNKYIWRCAATLKMDGMPEFEALEIMRELVKMIPGHETSKNCKNVAEIVGSIYRSRPYEEGRYKNLKPIPGLDAAILAVQIQKGNPLIGSRKVEGENCDPVKSKTSKTVSLSQIVPTIFNAVDKFINGKWRITEKVSNDEQAEIQRAALPSIIYPILIPILSQNSHAYVPGKSNHSRNKQIEQLNHVFNHSLKLDVKSFFDSIDQTILKSKMLKAMGSEITEVIFAAITTDRVYNGELQKRENGIPFGSSFTPILSNLYLNDFDHWLEAKGVAFTRFSDDIQIFSHSKEKLVSTQEAIKQYLKENLKLTLNENKTQFLECGDVV
jgi:hypothetical protein